MPCTAAVGYTGRKNKLTAGQELCRDEILKMLQLGRTPEWRTLVLGKAP